MLVGSLKPDTVTDLLRTLSQAKATAMLLLEHEGQSGYVRFDGGAIGSASLAQLRGEDAVAALKRWRTGHYALKRGAEGQPLASLAHVFLVVADDGLRKRISSCLAPASYETSSIFFPQELEELIEFLRPDLVISDCPHALTGVACETVVDNWRQRYSEPPTLIPLTDAPHSCGCDHPQHCRLAIPFEDMQLLATVASNAPRSFAAKRSTSELVALMHRELSGLLNIGEEPAGGGDEELTATERMAPDEVPDAATVENRETDVPPKHDPTAGPAPTEKPVEPTEASSLATAARSRRVYLLRAVAMLLLGSAALWIVTYMVTLR